MTIKITDEKNNIANLKFALAWYNTFQNQTNFYKLSKNKKAIEKPKGKLEIDLEKIKHLKFKTVASILRINVTNKKANFEFVYIE